MTAVLGALLFLAGLFFSVTGALDLGIPLLLGSVLCALGCLELFLRKIRSQNRRIIELLEGQLAIQKAQARKEGFKFRDEQAEESNSEAVSKWQDYQAGH